MGWRSRPSLGVLVRSDPRGCALRHPCPQLRYRAVHLAPGARRGRRHGWRGRQLGAVAMLNLFFKGHPIRKDKGIFNMGLTIVILTCTMVMPVYFPEHGGMFFKAGALGSYDPQIIKPPEGYRGADSVIMEGEEKPEKAASEAKEPQNDELVV